MSVADITPLELRDEFREQVAEKLKMGNGIVETLCKCKDGLLVPIELNVRPINYKGVPAALIVVRNITERKKAEKALIEAKCLAEESNRVKSEFIANMSHELRTPLNSVIGFSQILIDKEYGDLNEKQIRYVSNIQKSGNHLLDVINDILDFSKIESGKMDYEPEIINVNELIDETIVLMEPMIKAKSIDFKCKADFENQELSADKIKIKQIMCNLLSNAIKFTPANGKVWVDSKITNNNIQISVSDNGIGIPVNQQQSIFESFSQVNSSVSRECNGTGLGLSIAKHYVEMHGGEIWVKSEVREGSTFTFTIPMGS